jgi:hypothetical protein
LRGSALKHLDVLNLISAQLPKDSQGSAQKQADSPGLSPSNAELPKASTGITDHVETSEKKEGISGGQEGGGGAALTPEVSTKP